MQKNDFPKLRECPFCGGETRWDMKNKAPQCSKCLATIQTGGGILRKWFYESGYMAYMAALWNRRAGEEDKHEP